MPISEDEYDHHKQQHHGMSKAEQRRSNKPIMEKRRRARINHCLNELKSLILDAMKKDPARHSKLEKADILEMTVKHLQTVQRQQLAVAVATDPGVLHKFKTGFNECAGEVSRYIGRMDGVEPAVKQRLVAHLAHCVTGLQQLSPFSFASSGFPSALPQPPAGGDVNNNRGAGLQLIPSRLPTGEFALLLPSGGQIPGNVLPAFFPPQGNTAATTTSASNNSGPSSTVTSGSIDRSHPSAFTAVFNRASSPTHIRSNTPPPSHSFSHHHRGHQSPPLSPTSSVSSCDDGSSTSEAYPSPNSPPPPTVTLHIPSVTTQQHHHTQTTTTSFPLMVPFTATNAPSVETSQFKIPIVTPSTNFKTFHLETHKPQQQSLVTSSTSTNPEISVKSSSCPATTVSIMTPKSTASVGVGTFTEVKLEFKTIPMPGGGSLSSMFPIISSSSIVTPSNHPSTTVVSLSTDPLQQPLSVVTTHERGVVYKTHASTLDVRHSQHFTVTKDPPLDFSLKKDDFINTQQTASTQTQTLLGGIGHKRHLPASFSSLDTSDLVSSSSSSLSSPQVSLMSPNKMARYSFHVSPPSDANVPSMSSRTVVDTTQASAAFLRCADPRRLLSVVVEDLSNKASTSTITTTEVTEASTTSPTPTTSTGTSTSGASNKDMWRPW